jgi:hypothetical protein
MNTQRLGANALVIVTAVFLTSGSRHVSAMPLQPLARAANSDVATINCKPGTPNCTPAKTNAPSFCGGPGNPCVMDGAPDCQNASSCGTDNTGHHNLNGAGNMPGVIGARRNPTTGTGPAALKPATGAMSKTIR